MRSVASKEGRASPPLSSPPSSAASSSSSSSSSLSRVPASSSIDGIRTTKTTTVRHVTESSPSSSEISSLENAPSLPFRFIHHLQSQADVMIGARRRHMSTKISPHLASNVPAGVSSTDKKGKEETGTSEEEEEEKRKESLEITPFNPHASLPHTFEAPKHASGRSDSATEKNIKEANIQKQSHLSAKPERERNVATVRPYAHMFAPLNVAGGPMNPALFGLPPIHRGATMPFIPYLPMYGFLPPPQAAVSVSSSKGSLKASSSATSGLGAQNISSKNGAASAMPVSSAALSSNSSHQTLRDLTTAATMVSVIPPVNWEHRSAHSSLAPASNQIRPVQTVHDADRPYPDGDCVHPFWPCKREGCNGVLTLLGHERHHIMDIAKARKRAAWRRKQYPLTFVHGSVMTCSVCGDRPRLASRRSAWQRLCKICMEPYAMNGFWSRHGGVNSRGIVVPLKKRSPVHKCAMRRLAKHRQMCPDVVNLDEALSFERHWIAHAQQQGAAYCETGLICNSVLVNTGKAKNEERATESLSRKRKSSAIGDLPIAKKLSCGTTAKK